MAQSSLTAIECTVLSLSLRRKVRDYSKWLTSGGQQRKCLDDGVARDTAQEHARARRRVAAGP